MTEGIGLQTGRARKRERVWGREREINLAIVQKGKGGLLRGVGEAKNLVKNLKKSTKLLLVFLVLSIPSKTVCCLKIEYKLETFWWKI